MKGSKQCKRDGRLLLASDQELSADNGVEADLAEADFSPLEGKANIDHLRGKLPNHPMLKDIKRKM